MSLETDKQLMIDLHLRSRGINNEEVLEAFKAVNRENFVPERIKDYAYSDMALPIGFDATISQPYIVALMTQMLELEKEDKVLEIGTGSGYQAAILSKIVKRVITCEIDPNLVEIAKENLSKEDIKNVEVINNDGTNFNINKKFDKIVITAAIPKVSQNLIDMLKNNGILIAPEGNTMNQCLHEYTKKDGKLELTRIGIPVVFIPMKGEYGF